MNQDIRDITDASQFDEDSETGAIIKVIGVGGGGGNAINYMYEQHIKHINFVVCNTDKQALKMSPVPNQLLLGEEITHGLGAGNVPEVGRQCAEASIDDIRALFQDETEMVFITAGMGGGTGTGAAPVVARVAKECGMLTIGIVTVPFLFEGEKKVFKAIDGAKEMQKHVDALLIINNENLIELYKDLNFFNAFHKADDTLANAARSISEIISEPCYVNVDFQDVKTTLKDAGSAIIATAEGEGEKRITQAIHNALHSPLLKTHDITTSKRLLLKFICSKDSERPISTGEMGEITAFTSKLPSTIDVKWGIGDDPTMGDKVKVTVLASGFDVTIRNADGGADGGNGQAAIVMSGGGAPQEPKTISKQKEEEVQIAEVYGHDKMIKKKREADKMKYAVLKESQFDDHEAIALIERTPALNRTPHFFDSLNRLSNPQDANQSSDHRSAEEVNNGGSMITF
jgi:cell division protein FtsZ